MKVVYGDSFKSIVKAAIISEVKSYVPVKSINLNDSCFVRADDFSLDELFVEWDWAHGTPHNISGLESAVKLALKHKNCSYDLIFSVVRQALEKGVDYVLTRSSADSNRFCDYVYHVRSELRSAKLRIRFNSQGDFMVGKCFMNHDISDLLLDFYQKRFPGKRVVITGFEHMHVNTERPVPVGIGAQSFPQLTSFVN